AGFAINSSLRDAIPGGKMPPSTAARMAAAPLVLTTVNTYRRLVGRVFSGSQPARCRQHTEVQENRESIAPLLPNSRTCPRSVLHPHHLRFHETHEVR